MQNINNNNSLNKSLQTKYPHLELAILPLSQVQKDNKSKRIDSEYFKKEYLENEQRLLNLNVIQLKDTDISIKHPAEIQRNYIDSENGVWFFSHTKFTTFIYRFWFLYQNKMLKS